MYRFTCQPPDHRKPFPAGSRCSRTAGDADGELIGRRTGRELVVTATGEERVAVGREDQIAKDAAFMYQMDL